METLQEIHQKQRKATLVVLAIFALCWAFTEWKTVFAGLIVGTAFGLYNFWILVRRYENYERMLSEGKKRVSLGTGLRFASGIAAAALAITMPETFNLISTVIGFAIPYALFLGERIIYHVRHYS